MLTAALQGAIPATSDGLLADARYLGQWASTRQPQQAVLFAAMACEIKASGILRSLAVDLGMLPLLDLVLNHKGFPQAAHELFHTVPKALVDRSLHDEDREANGRVKALFSCRNKVVHEGLAPTPEAAQAHVRAAAVAFKWLASLVPKLPVRGAN